MTALTTPRQARDVPPAKQERGSLSGFALRTPYWVVTGGLAILGAIKAFTKSDSCSVRASHARKRR